MDDLFGYRSGSVLDLHAMRNGLGNDVIGGAYVQLISLMPSVSQPVMAQPWPKLVGGADALVAKLSLRDWGLFDGPIRLLAKPNLRGTTIGLATAKIHDDLTGRGLG